MTSAEVTPNVGLLRESPPNERVVAMDQRGSSLSNQQGRCPTHKRKALNSGLGIIVICQKYFELERDGVECRLNNK